MIEPSTAASASGTPSAPGKATILIVDDLSANRAVLVALLESQGHRLIEAADGREGLAAVRAEHPDLVITDVLMPVMDGYELVRQLRLDPATRDMPVVFYTAHYGEREAWALAHASGVDYVLTKPVESKEVLTVVGRVLAGDAEAGKTADVARRATESWREDLLLLTDPLSEGAGDLRTANARLRALINIGLELASERDANRLLQRVCVAARDLFGATYATLGIIDLNVGTVQHVVTSGADTGNRVETGDALTGVLRTVVAERRTMRGNHPDGDPEIHAFLAAPMASPDHVYGWICLAGNEGRTFSEDDEHMVLALAGHVGRLYELDYEILERKRVESALRHARDRAQRYLDTADVILLALDLQGRITLINRKGCDLLGWTRSELLGRDWIATCLPERMRDAGKQKMHDLLRGDLSGVETWLLTKAGEERLIEWRNTLLRDDAGLVIGTFGSGTDVSARNRAVEALRTAEERMGFALVAAGVGIWEMDYATGAVQMSEILELQYGLQPGTFAGTFEAFVERIHPDDRESVRQTVRKAARSGSDFSLLNRSAQSNGALRWLSGAGRILLGEHGEPVRGVGISMDVTERRMLEVQYQQAQKMDAIGRLAGGVAHDFNNLLTAILGYCELLLADLNPDDSRHGDVIEIQKAGTSAAGLTRQLLAFSRKQIIEPTLLDLNRVVTDMRAMLGRLIREDVKVVLALGPDLAYVMADCGQIEQIVVNLAVNARDAMPLGGTLTIETANVELDENYSETHVAAKPGPYVALTVTDTGTGMTPEVQARLFEPFFTTKEPGKGTGLGLATVHGIVARNGGIVNVYSEAGRGTSFKMYFPRAETAEQVNEAPALTARLPAGAETVLVVEDADGLRALAKRLLERLGYTVLVAANADEALRVFEHNASIDVILTDIVMPGASGPELSRRLVQQRPTLKVIYMSGYTEESIVQHGVLNPGIAFLHKPFTAETLGRKIREVLDR